MLRSVVRHPRGESIATIAKLSLILDPSSFDFDDVRNTASFPNYEAHGQPSFERYLRPGPMTEVR